MKFRLCRESDGNMNHTVAARVIQEWILKGFCRHQRLNADGNGLRSADVRK